MMVEASKPIAARRKRNRRFSQSKASLATVAPVFEALPRHPRPIPAQGPVQDIATRAL